MEAGSSGDAERQAQRLIEHFGSLAAVFAARPGALEGVLGAGSRAARCITASRAAWLCAMREPLTRDAPLSPPVVVAEYLLAVMGGLRAEEIRVLFLDSGQRLLRDEIMTRGTLTEAPIYPREIMRRALELGAAGLILAHNHPSGDATPSGADKAMTHRVASAGRELGVTLHDHFIVAGPNWVSFQAEGWLRY